jgi:hypothetical protein
MSNYFISGETADGDYSTDKVNDRDQHYYLSIVFYSDAALTQVATPTAGTVTVTASETGEQYGNVGTIDATLAGANSSYDRLKFSGSISSVNVNLLDVAGASHFRFKIGAYE